MKRIVILGGGTGGTIAANRLRHVYGSGEAEIIVIDQDDNHVYQPGLLFVPFGLAEPGRLSPATPPAVARRSRFPAGRYRPC